MRDRTDQLSKPNNHFHAILRVFKSEGGWGDQRVLRGVLGWGVGDLFKGCERGTLVIAGSLIGELLKIVVLFGKAINRDLEIDNVFFLGRQLGSDIKNNASHDLT